jgi:HTH-type transcriptional regulator / antitoxin HipB
LIVYISSVLIKTAVKYKRSNKSMKSLDSLEVGRIIRQARKAAGLTQADAAALCAVSVPFLSHLEGGKPTVQLNKALHVAAQLGVQFLVQTPAKPKRRP